MAGDLRDHAEEPTEFTLASDLPDAGVLELSSLATVEAENIPGDYPQYGTFIECDRGSGDEWIECPRGLARELTEHDAEPGFEFSVERASKVGGSWEFEIDEQG